MQDLSVSWSRQIEIQGWGCGSFFIKKSVRKCQPFL